MSEHHNEAEQDEVVRRIAKEKLGIETLVTRNSDSLDFHDCSVWRIEAALKAAYVAGYSARPHASEACPDLEPSDTGVTEEPKDMDEQIADMEIVVLDGVANLGIELLIAALRDACGVAAEVAEGAEDWTGLSMALHYRKGLTDLLGEE